MKKIISYIVFIIVGIIPLFTFGQQSSVYSQYMFNGLAINPAHSGYDEMLSLSFLSRNQTVGLKGSPNTQTFSAHTPIKRDKIGVGFQVIHESIGVTDQTGIYGSYSYRIKLNDYSISFGLQGGLNVYKTAFTDLYLTDPDDPNFIENTSSVKPNIGSGVLIYDDHLYAGISMPQMLNVGRDLEVIQEQPFIVHGGYVFKLGTSLLLKPSMLMKIVNGRPVEWNINTNVLIKDLIWVGASFRPMNALVFMLEIQLTEQLALGYAYDATLNEIRAADKGSHEIMLNYKFRFSKKDMVSPRYF